MVATINRSIYDIRNAVIKMLNTIRIDTSIEYIRKLFTPLRPIDSVALLRETLLRAAPSMMLLS